MICLTSISPQHPNEGIQQKAVKSWLDLGLEVVSLNNKEECDLLRPLYLSVLFIETLQTSEHHYGKPYVSISAAIDWAKAQHDDTFCLINSDIELKCDIETIDRISEKSKTSIVIANRINYDHLYEGELYLWGIDVFFIHSAFLHIFPQSLYCFGQCFWDYWIPYTALKANINVVLIKQHIAYHKDHKPQWNNEHWLRTGRQFRLDANLQQYTDIKNDAKAVGIMSSYVKDYLYKTIKRIEI